MRKSLITVATLLAATNAVADNAASVYGGWEASAYQEVTTTDGGGADVAGFGGASAGWSGNESGNVWFSQGQILGPNGASGAVLGGVPLIVETVDSIQPSSTQFTYDVVDTAPATGSVYVDASTLAGAATKVDDKADIVSGTALAANSANVILESSTVDGAFGGAFMSTGADVDATTNDGSANLQLFTVGVSELCNNSENPYNNLFGC